MSGRGPPDAGGRARSPGRGRDAIGSEKQEPAEIIESQRAEQRAFAISCWIPAAPAAPPIDEMLAALADGGRLADFCSPAECQEAKRVLGAMQSGLTIDPVSAGIVTEIFRLSVARSIWGASVTRWDSVLTSRTAHGWTHTDVLPHVAVAAIVLGSA